MYSIRLKEIPGIRPPVPPQPSRLPDRLRRHMRDIGKVEKNCVTLLPGPPDSQ